MIIVKLSCLYFAWFLLRFYGIFCLTRRFILTPFSLYIEFHQKLIYMLIYSLTVWLSMTDLSYVRSQFSASSRDLSFLDLILLIILSHLSLHFLGVDASALCDGLPESVTIVTMHFVCPFYLFPLSIACSLSPHLPDFPIARPKHNKLFHHSIILPCPWVAFYLSSSNYISLQLSA